MLAKLIDSTYIYILYPGMACVLSLVLTRICISVLPRFGFIDMPHGRHVHAKPTPRGGGFAIIAAFFATAVLYLEIHPVAQMREFVMGLAAPAALLMVTGALDDRFSLSSRTKLALQIVVGLLVYWANVRLEWVFGIMLPGYLSILATVLWVVTIVNAFNLIDGMDGVAAGLGMLSAISLGVWSLLGGGAWPGMAVVVLILAGSCAGFLRYNYSPARIFMGDTGSMFLGLFFAYCGLHSFGKSATVTSLLVPLLAVGVPLFDVMLAFWRRLVRRLLNPDQPGGIMTADLQHLHHRLLQEFRDQRKVALRIYLLACLLAGIGFLALFFESTVPAIGYAALLLLVLFVVRRIAGIELYDSARLLKHGLSRPRKLLLVQYSIPVVDVAMLLGAEFIAADINGIYGGNIFVVNFLCLATPIMLALTLGGSYRVLWLRAGMEDLRTVIEAAVFGILAACYICFMFRYGRPEGNFAGFLLVYALSAFLGIFLLRVLLIYVGMCMLWKLKQTSDPSVRQREVAVYGGGLNASLYLGHIYGSPAPEAVHLVGIVDDDAALSGLRLFGLPVLGKTSDLDRIAEKHPIDELVITTENVPAEKVEALREFSSRRGIRLTRFFAGERPVCEDCPKRNCPDGCVVRSKPAENGK